MGELHVRPERAPDHEAIAELVAAAFGSPVEARLVAAIRDSEHYLPELALVAERNGRVIGHVMISHVWLDGPDGRRSIASLSPLAVAPDQQGRGVGGALVQAVVDRARQRGEPLVVLEGSPDYYGRFGFEHALRHGIELDLPSWAPPEAAQVLRLGDATGCAGRVAYPPAFAEVAHD